MSNRSSNVAFATNCKDKVNGHVYTRLSKKEAEDARKALKLYEGIPIYKCPKCNKIKQSM